jgi:hypothetical protein
MADIAAFCDAKTWLSHAAGVLRGMKTFSDRAIADLASRQHGVFDDAQLRELKATHHEMRLRVESGRWRRLYEGIYTFAGVPLSWQGLLFAAQLAGGTDAVASHRSAAALHDLPGGNRAVAEITCVRWRRARHDGLVVHESSALAREDCTVVDNIRVTSVELTLLMLGAVCPPLTVEMALDVALRRELVTYESVRALLKRLGRRGRNGAGVLRAILDERVPERAVAESPMETKLLRLLRDLGFPTPVPQYEVWIQGRFYGRLDAAYPEQRVGLEYQSYEHHAGKLAIDHDNARRRRFRAIEWDIIEVTPEDLRTRGLRLAPALWQALRRAS